MKKIIYIVQFLVLFLLTAPQLESQVVDTLAIVQIGNVIQIKPDSVVFDMRLKRNSDKWQKFANGTFQLTLADTAFKINPDSMTIDLVQGTSEFKLATFSGGGQLPVTDYYITPRVFTGRLSITIAGPEDYKDAQTIPPPDTSLLIGQFVMASKIGKLLPRDLLWLQPQYYYQACAYKLKDDSLLDSNVVMYHANDNIEMDDGMSNYVSYRIEKSVEPAFVLDSFVVEYAGKKRVHIWWVTGKEAYNKGFILKRALMNPSISSPDAQDWQTIARFDGPTDLDKILIGLGTRTPGKRYDYEYDTVRFRSADYCYRLYYEDFNGLDHYLATGCVRIPNSVITKAHAYPNPFSDKTHIEVFLEDNVMLTATVYDLKGRELEKLRDEGGKVINNIEEAVGKHVYDFSASQYASQGLYDVIFIAYPLEDLTIEISRAVVKLQLIR